MKTQIKPMSRKENIVVQELESELLIYDLKIDKVFSLNETSALVWQMCDGENSLGEISRQLSAKLKTPIGEDFVWLALNDLKKENLLINGDEIDGKFEGMSRREVVRKIGFASMIALPIIVSLISPTSLMAQSCVGSGGLPPNQRTGYCFPAATAPSSCNSAFITNFCCSGNAEARSDPFCPTFSPFLGCYCT